MEKSSSWSIYIIPLITAIVGYMSATYKADMEYKKEIDALHIEIDSVKTKNDELRNNAMIDDRKNTIATIKNGILQVQSLSNGYDIDSDNSTRMQQAGKVFDTTSKALASINTSIDINRDYSALQVAYNNLTDSVKKLAIARFYGKENEAKIANEDYKSSYNKVQCLSISLIERINALPLSVQSK